MNESTTRGGVADRFVFWPLAILIALAPLFFIPSTAYPFEATKVILIVFGVLLTLCLFIVSRIEEQGIVFPRQLSLLAVWLLPAAYGVSSLWSGNSRSAFSGSSLEIDTFYFMLLGAIALTVTALVAGSARRLRLISWAAALSFAVVSLFQLIRLFGGPDTLSFGGIFAGSAANLLGKWNEVGIFYGLAASLFLVTLAMRISSGKKIAAAVGLAVSLLMMMVVNLSIAWALLAVVALVVFVAGVWGRMVSGQQNAYGEYEEAPRAPLTAAFVAAVVLLISGFFAVPASWIFSNQALSENGEPRNFMANRFNIVYLEARPSWEGTVAIMKNTYKESALFGSGPGTFAQEWLKVKPLDVNRTIFWNVDFLSGVGLVPTSAVTTGVAGLAAWIVFFAALLLAGFRAFIMRSGSAVHSMTLLSFIAATYLFTAAIFYTPGPVLLILAFIAAGLFFASLQYSGSVSQAVLSFEENPRFGFVVTLLAIVVFLGSAATMFLMGTKYVSAVYYQDALVALNVDGDLDRASSKIALSSTFGSSPRSERLAATIALTEVQNVLNNDSLTPEEARVQFEEHFGEAVRHAEAAIDLGPSNYQNWTLLGRATEIVVPLGNEEGYKRAADAYERAIALNPQNPTLHLLRGNLEILRGDHAAAKPFVEQALQKKADHTEAIFVLAQIQMAENNVPEAIRSVEQAAQITPNNPVLFFQLGLLYYSESRFADAAAAFERATAINTDYANAHYFLGLTYDLLKRRDDAVAQFEEVLRTNPGNEEVETIIANLKSNQAPFGGVAPGDLESLEGLPIQE